jgi:hypothetical protein
MPSGESERQRLVPYDSLRVWIWAWVCTLDEEHRNVVSNNIPVTLVGVELDGETTHVSHGVGTSTATKHGGEAHEDGGGSACVGEHTSAGELRDGVVEFEVAESTSALFEYAVRNLSRGFRGFGLAGTYSCVDDSLRNSLVVESHNLGADVSA